MLRTTILVFFLTVSALTCLQGQNLGAPEWSNVPFSGKGKAPWMVHGAYCVNGSTYSFVDIAIGKEQYVGYIQPRNGAAISKPVVIPTQKGHISYSGFCMVGDKPCVLYTLWDKKTDVVSAFVQAFTDDGFDPSGGPLKLGDLPFAKSYNGDFINIQALPSPDGSKMLFLSDDIQQAGMKIALCWVMDNELNMLWNATYRIPMQSFGSYTNHYFMDNGHLYIRVHGVAVTADNVKEKSDGSIAVKTDTKMKNETYLWYDMHGETMNQWDCSVPDMPGAFIGSPVMADGQVVMAGLMMPEGKEITEGHATYVLLRMNDDFTPAVIASGDMAVPSARDVRSMNDQEGNIFIAAYGDGIMDLLKLNTAGDMQWQQQKPESTRLGRAVGDKLYFVYRGNDATLADLRNGVHPKLPSGTVFPILTVWDAKGNTTVTRVFPEGTKTSEQNDGHVTFTDCGCYSQVSADKQHPGMVRVCIEK